MILLLGSLTGCQNSKPSTAIVQTVSIDSLLQKAPEYKKREINYEKCDTINKTSEPFHVNSIKCYWEFSIVICEGAAGGIGITSLKNVISNKIILTNTDYTELNNFNSIDKNNLEFNKQLKDVNFDGFMDFVIYSREDSGSGGEFYNVYIFNNVSQTFELSRDLSGGEFQIDTENKTVSNYWKMGVGWNSSQVHHFDKNGKIKFTETTTREEIEGKSSLLIKTTYKTSINGKIVKTKIDTTEVEGY